MTNAGETIGRIAWSNKIIDRAAALQALGMTAMEALDQAIYERAKKTAKDIGTPKGDSNERTEHKPDLDP